MTALIGPQCLNTLSNDDRGASGVDLGSRYTTQLAQRLAGPLTRPDSRLLNNSSVECRMFALPAAATVFETTAAAGFGRLLLFGAL